MASEKAPRKGTTAWWRVRRPESELRHWSTYESVHEWYEDYHGYVPSMMAAGLSQRMTANPGLTFPQMYAAMLGRRAVIRVHEGDEPPCHVCELLHGPAPEATTTGGEDEPGDAIG